MAEVITIRLNVTNQKSITNLTKRIDVLAKKLADLENAINTVGSGGGRSGGGGRRATGGGGGTGRGILTTAGGNLLSATITTITRSLGGLSKALISNSIQIDAFNRKNAVVLGDSLANVEQRARDVASQFGFTESAFVDLTAATADVLKPLGFGSEAAAAFGQDIVELAGVLSVWSGGLQSAEEAAAALGKGLLGEGESLKTFGINLKQADVQARVAELGLGKLTGAAQKQAAALVTLDILYEQSTDAQRQFEEGGGTLIRTQAELRAELGNTFDDLSVKLAPAFNSILQIALSFVQFVGDKLAPAFTSIASGAQRAANFLGVALPMAIGFLRDTFDPLIDALSRLGDEFRVSSETGANFFSRAIARIGERLQFLVRAVTFVVNVLTGLTQIVKDAAEANNFLGRALRFIGGEVQRVLFFFNNFSTIMVGLGAAISAFAQNARREFQILGLQVEKFGQQLQKTVGVGSQKAIDDINRQIDQLRDSNVNIRDAFNQAFEDARVEVDIAAIDEQAAEAAAKQEEARQVKLANERLKVREAELKRIAELQASQAKTDEKAAKKAADDQLKRTIETIQQEGALRIQALAFQGLTEERFLEQRKMLELQTQAEIIQARIDAAMKAGEATAVLDLQLADNRRKQADLEAKQAEDRRQEQLDKDLDAIEQRQIQRRLAAGASIDDEEQLQEQLTAINLEADIERAELQLSTDRLNATERLKVEEELQNKRQELAELTAEKQLTIAEKLRQDILSGIAETFSLTEEQSIEVLEAIETAVPEFIGNTVKILDNLAQGRIDSINREFDARIERAKGNAELEEQLEAEKDAKITEIKKRQFIRDKVNAISTIAIQTAIAVVESLPNLVLAGIVSALGLSQIAVVASRQFKAKRGLAVGAGGTVGTDGFVRGRKHPQGGVKTIQHGVPVEVEHGEFIDMDEFGRYLTVNAKGAQHFKSNLKGIHGKIYNGKAADLSAYNTWGGHGIRLAQQGTAITNPSSTPNLGARAAASRGGGTIIVKTELAPESIEQLTTQMKESVIEGQVEGTVLSSNIQNREAERTNAQITEIGVS